MKILITGGEIVEKTSDHILNDYVQWRTIVSNHI